MLGCVITVVCSELEWKSDYYYKRKNSYWPTTTILLILLCACVYRFYSPLISKKNRKFQEKYRGRKSHDLNRAEWRSYQNLYRALLVKRKISVYLFSNVINDVEKYIIIKLLNWYLSGRKFVKSKAVIHVKDKIRNKLTRVNRLFLLNIVNKILRFYGIKLKIQISHFILHKTSLLTWKPAVEKTCPQRNSYINQFD